MQVLYRWLEDDIVMTGSTETGARQHKQLSCGQPRMVTAQHPKNASPLLLPGKYREHVCELPECS